MGTFMNISIPFFDRNSKIIQHTKTTQEISKLIDNIFRQWNYAQKNHYLDPSKTIIIINEIDFYFIKEYINQQGYYSNNIGYSKTILFGLEIRKMKQEGFIFAYE